MRQVAERTGASLGSIYYHFENKEAILHAIICGNFRRVIGSLDERLDGVDEPRQALEHFIENHISFFARHMAMMRVMSHELDALSGEYGEEEAQLRRAYTRRAREILKRLRPDLSADELRVTTLGLFGMLNWTYRWFPTLPRSGNDPLVLAQRLAALFLDGLRDYEPPAGGRRRQ